MVQMNHKIDAKYAENYNITLTGSVVTRLLPDLSTASTSACLGQRSAIADRRLFIARYHGRL